VFAIGKWMVQLRRFDENTDQQRSTTNFEQKHIVLKLIRFDYQEIHKMKGNPTIFFRKIKNE
jgi:hypothetical protein